MLWMIFNIGTLSIHPKVEAIDIATIFCIRKIKISTSVFQQLIAEGSIICAVRIRPHMKPDKIQTVGGAIAVFNFCKTIQRMFAVIQFYIN